MPHLTRSTEPLQRVCVDVSQVHYGRETLRWEVGCQVCVSLELTNENADSQGPF